MKLVATPLPGAWVVELEPHTDERGTFARTFDAELLAAHGFTRPIAQMSTSGNLRAGTLRGLHFQSAPHAEIKLIRVTRGAAYDVIVELATREWFAVEMTEDNSLGLLVPAGFAHGFQTLVDDTEVLYAMDEPYVAGAATGVRWDDPVLGIDWPAPPAAGRTLSARDRSWADLAG